MSIVRNSGSPSARFISKHTRKAVVRGAPGTWQRSSAARICAASVALLLAACGGDNNKPNPSPVPEAGTPIAGEAVKGLVCNGVVKVYAIVSGVRQATAIPTGSTTDAGAFDLNVPADSSGTAIIEITPRAAGSTPATTVRCDHPAGSDSAGAAIVFGAISPSTASVQRTRKYATHSGSRRT